MQLHTIQPNTGRKRAKRVGRGGKRGTFSGKGTKGQKSRAGASVRPGFRGADNRLWQLFPKLRGASKKPGSDRPHRKHRFYQFRRAKAPASVNVGAFNRFPDGERVTVDALVQAGIVAGDTKKVKILGSGELKRKLIFEGFAFSASAREKIEKIGGTIVS